MNLRPQRQQRVEINLTPLIDVVFLLLIFFMVSTTFKDEARLRIQLPEAQGEEVPDEQPEQIRIVIDRSGNYFVDDQRVVDRRPVTLQRALRGALGDRGDELPVLIQADANATHQSVMTALDAAATVGLVRIGFSASRPESGDPSGQPSGEQGTDAAGPAAPGSESEREPGE